MDSEPLPRYLQLMWAREPSGRPGPRPGRTIEEIGLAAVEIADRHGLDAVSMKSVARTVELTPMSLYRYVDSKDQLIAVMVDVGYGRPPTGLTARGTWRLRLERWARGIAGVCMDHPWITTVPLPDPPSTPNALAWTDAGLRSFRPTALSVGDRLSSLLVIDGWVRAHVRMSLQFGFLGNRETAPVPYGSVGHSIIDPSRFPDLSPALPTLADDSATFFDDELRFGLSVILDGIAARVATAEHHRTTAFDGSAG